MKKQFVCNYAILRFLPYPETEEFVNIGVVLCCPELKTFDFKIESKRRDRVSAFFPELDMEVFTIGRKEFLHELKRVKTDLDSHNHPGQTGLRFMEIDFIEIFKEIAKPRESMFRFGEIGTRISEKPENEIDSLFEYYVGRQFAVHEEYQETIMANRLRKQFKASDILRYYKIKAVGNEEYKVSLPFVHEIEAKHVRYKAIKPLYFDKPDTTRIYEYGDRWLNRIERLRKIKELPEQMLFVVHPTKNQKKLDACEEIFRALKALKVDVLPETDQDKILDFARID